jgi:hypothetical protein
MEADRFQWNLTAKAQGRKGSRGGLFDISNLRFAIVLAPHRGFAFTLRSFSVGVDLAVKTNNHKPVAINYHQKY